MKTATLPQMFLYFFLVLPTTTRMVLSILQASVAKQVYSLLPHQYWQGVFALVCYL